MKRFKKILYLIDAKSLRAGTNVDKVATLARLNEARVTLTLVEEGGLFDNLGISFSGKLDAIKQALHQESTEHLNRLLADSQWEGIQVRGEQLMRADFIEIIRKVLREGYDLVIKEAALLNGLDQLAMRLVRKCPCPVWVMKQGAGNFKRILGAVDVGDEYPETPSLNKKIIELTHSLAQREGGEAHYLHSWRLEHESMLRGPRIKVTADEINELKRAVFEERHGRMLQLLSNAHISYQEHQLHLREGMSTEVIERTIRDLEIDVVVMGSVARSGIPGLLIGNKAERLLNSITCTVLTVKPDGFITPVTVG